MSVKDQIMPWLAELPAENPIWSMLRLHQKGGARPTQMAPPDESTLPLFVYGAFKPGMPAYERLREFVERYDEDSVEGELFVRDGLPLLRLNGCGTTEGFGLYFKAGLESEGYDKVCEFEPRSQYEWKTVALGSGIRANVLAERHVNLGNPVALNVRSWNLRDDAPFGSGLDAVEKVLGEAEAMPQGSGPEPNFEKFFRSQMAYLLLWSILERLSALCLGPSGDPHKRINQLHELPEMGEIVRNRVKRTDQVFDTRNPKTKLRLDGSDPKRAFAYFYQVRCNLSHRGKGAFGDFDKVHDSLRELLAITRDFLASLPSTDQSRRP